MRGEAPAFELDPMALSRDADLVDQAILPGRPAPAARPRADLFDGGAGAGREARRRWLGTDRAAALIEGAFATIARSLLAGGVRRFVVAGGETAGAVVQALDVKALRIGRRSIRACPGPWRKVRRGSRWR